MINIRDWHAPGTAYDVERRVYGTHCERGTWGAKYVDSLEKYLAWGSLFLMAMLVFAVWSAVAPDDVSWAIPSITGGVGLIQLVTVFHTQPTKDLQRNLMNLTTYRRHT